MSPKAERIDPSMRMVIAPGVTAVGQIAKTGRRSFITHSESREFFWLEDEKGRGSYFYRSFAGTGGKQQGAWFPVGGVFADQRGEAIWIVKGSLRREPDYGRPTLGHFAAKVNDVLPHSDADVDRMIERLTGTKGGFGWAASDDLAVIPVFQLVSPVPKAAEEWGSWLLDFWKQNGMNKVWGKRGEVLSNPLNKGADEKGRARDKRLRKWVGDQVTMQLLEAMGGAIGRGNKLHNYGGHTVSSADMLQQATTHALNALTNRLEVSDVENLMRLEEQDPDTLSDEERDSYYRLHDIFRAAVSNAAANGMAQIAKVRLEERLGSATTQGDRNAMIRFQRERKAAIKLLKMYESPDYVPSDKQIAAEMYRIEYTRDPAKTLVKYQENLKTLQYPTYKPIEIGPPDSDAEKTLRRDIARATATDVMPSTSMIAAEERAAEEVAHRIAIDVIRDLLVGAVPRRRAVLESILELWAANPPPDNLVKAVAKRSAQSDDSVREVMRAVKSSVTVQLEEIERKRLSEKRQPLLLESPRLLLKNGRRR